MKWFIAALVLVAPLSSIAGPPFNYSSAVAWADDTVKTSVPKARRIYLFGPKKVTETYLSNNKPATHDVSVRRILGFEDGIVLGTLLRGQGDTPGDYTVIIHRREENAMKPALTLPYAEALKSKFDLRPLDAIEIKTPPRGLVL
jgi:hypothetical protein